MLESFLMILDRQGKLKGDLNVVQRAGLYWLINHEIEDQTAMQLAELKHQALASNANTSPEYIKSLFREEHEELPSPDDPTIDLGEWETPQTPQDLELLIKRLHRENAGTVQ